MRYEITHDTMAKQVYEKASTEARTRRKIEREIEEAYKAYKERGARLTQDDLDYYGPYLDVVNISEEERAFIEYARTRLIRTRNRIRMIVGAAIIVLMAFSITSFLLYQNSVIQTKEAKAQKLIAEKNEKEAIRQTEIAQSEKKEAENQKERAIKNELGANRQEKIAQRKTLESITARENAETKKNQAESLVLANIANNLSKTEINKSLRILQAAFTRTHPDLPPGPVLNSLSSKFYEQLGTEEGLLNLLHRTFDHEDPVLSGKFSPDGIRILTISGPMGSSSAVPKKVTLWDLERKTKSVLKENVDLVTSASFSSDGKFIAISSSDGAVDLWTCTGIFLRTIGHRKSVRKSIFNSKGQILTISSDSKLRIWNTDGTLVDSLYSSENLTDMDVSSDGAQILLVSRRGITLVNEHLEIDTILRHPKGVRGASFSSSGNKILTICRDNHDYVMVYGRNGQGLDSLAHKGRVDHALYSPNEELILTSCNEGGYRFVRLWNKEGELRDSFKYLNRVMSMSFSPDSKYFMVTNLDGNNVLRKVDSEVVAHLDKDPEKAATFTSFSPDGKYLLTGSYDETAKLWYLNGELIVKLNGSSFFSPNGDIVENGYNKVRILKLSGEQRVQLPGIIPSSIHSFARNGQHFITRMIDTVLVWNASFEKVGTIKATALGLVGIYFTPDSKYIQTNTYDRRSIILKLDGTPVDTFWRSNKYAEELFTLDGKKTTLTKGEKNPNALDSYPELLARIEDQIGEVNSSIASPDQNYFLTYGKRDAGFNVYEPNRLWNGKAELIATFKTGYGLGHTFFFSPDGSFLMGDDPRGVSLWPLPERIYKYLKEESEIPKFTEEEKIKYGITDSR